MLLKENNFLEPMKLVYQLRVELENDPEQVSDVQALTLDDSKPHAGLSGENGLFGSDEWWSNIKKRVVPTRHVSGVIEKLYITGMEPSNIFNTFDLILDEDWSSISESIYVNDEKDYDFFKVGARVDILYALEKLKSASDMGDENQYSSIVLEMAVSF